MGNRIWVRRAVTAFGPAAAFGLVATPVARAAEPAPGAEEPPVVAEVSTSAHRPVPSLPGSIAEASSLDIPGRAVAAYQRTETLLAVAAPDCHLDWELLAGVGRVESGHGERRRHELTENGLVQPAIVGRKLDGTRETSLVPDSDGGQYDGDPVHDRAIGPMKLLPSAWTAVAVDADGDGDRNPQDLDDAALGAALLLCDAGTDLADPTQRAQALRRLNDDRRYVRVVVRFAAAYAVPVELPMTLQVWTPAPTLIAPADPEKDPEKEADEAKAAKAGGKKATSPAKSGTTSTPAPAPAAPTQAPAPAPSPSAAPDPTPTPDPTPDPTPTTEPQPEPSPEASSAEPEPTPAP